MKKINIVADVSNAPSIEGFENISIQSIRDIFSCSVQVIYCDIFSNIGANDAYQVLEILTDKIIPTGQLIIKLYDIKKICELYLLNNITEQSFFELIKSVSNPINYAALQLYCDNVQKIKVIDIKRSDIFTTVTLIKNNV